MAIERALYDKLLKRVLARHPRVFALRDEFRVLVDPEEGEGDLADFGGPNEEPDDGDTFPLRWGWEECRLDAASEIGPQLPETMPGATFSAWSDPKYEYPGEIYRYAPGLGGRLRLQVEGVLEREGGHAAEQRRALVPVARRLDAPQRQRRRRSAAAVKLARRHRPPRQRQGGNSRPQ
mgnify:CR=1 FL=1